jgi:TRAP-type mannitol/chloroaromatic compound transport system substrate-binding protein
VIPGWWEGSAGITAPVNLAAWETPPALCKTAFEMAANEQILLMLARYDARSWMRCAGWSPAAASSALSPPGVGGGPQGLLRNLRGDRRAEDFRTLYGPWKRFLESSNPWFRVAEFSLDGFRLGRDVPAAP